MFDNYNDNYYTSNIKINACSGGIYKTYKESWFIRFNLKSPLMERLSNHENVRYSSYLNEYGCEEEDFKRRSWSTNYYDSAKPVVVLQMVICGDMEVIAEIMYKEDFEKYFERKNENNE